MTIQEWFDKYGESHQNPINKAIHWICVPAIFFSIVGILSTFSFTFDSQLVPDYLLDYLNMGTLLVVFGLIFFSRLSLSITFGMAFIVLLIFKGIGWMKDAGLDVLITNLWIFTIAWIGQFIGHKIEGAKPSFFDDLKFLLIGPAWLLSFIYKSLGIKY